MALPFKILSQTQFTAISLAEAKSQCRLMSSQTIDDLHISSLIKGAASSAQEYLHWLVSVGQIKQYSENAGYIQLVGKFVSTIDEITATDLNGEDVVITDYSYNDVTEQILIPVGLYVDIFITYTCGASKDNLPENVKQGILMLISTMYNNREDFITGLSVAQMPMTSKHLLGLNRHYVS